MSETLAHNEIKHNNGTPRQTKIGKREAHKRARWERIPAFRRENISKASTIAMWVTF